VVEKERAIDDVIAERQRQMSVEGWTREHDDREHGSGELARAAAAYALHAGSRFSWGSSEYQRRVPPDCLSPGYRVD
jgi:hypothetical protein